MSEYAACIRTWLGTLLVALVAVPSVAFGEPVLWMPPQLAPIVEEGLKENNDIRSLEARVDSLIAEIPYAGSLEDPRLGLAVLNLPADSFRFDREPMTQKQISIAQKFPWFGKLDLRSQRAALIAARLEAVLNVRRIELARDIALTFYDLGFAETGIRINAQLTEEISQLLQVAETRYATGRGLQQDVLQAQVELGKLLDEKIALENRRRILEDRLHELLNRKAHRPIAPMTDPEEILLDLNVTSIQSRTLADSLDLLVRQADIRIADIDVELARKDFWPDFDFKLAYGQRDEDFTGRDLPDFVTGAVVLNIPLWQQTRQQPKLEAALKARAAASQSHRALLTALPHKVDALSAEIQNTRQSYNLFKDALMLQAEQWAQSSLSAYEVGSVEFNTMIAARVQLLRFELQLKRYLFEIYKKRAQLERVVGGPIASESR